MRILYFISFIFLISISILKSNELRILTYGSFNSDWGPGPSIQKEFESFCNCKLIWTTADSSGALLTKLILSDNKEQFDIVLGLDDSLMNEALQTSLFLPHQIDEDSLKGLNIDWNNDVFVPFDYGMFAFIYDSRNIKNPPKALSDLIQSKYKIIITDPRTSTPGLGFVKWVKQIYEEQSFNFWKELNASELIVSKSWSDAYGLFLEGEADLVLSYTTSPAYHSIIEETDYYKAALFNHGHAQQIEIMGKLKNGQNLELANQFLRFSLNEGFQKNIPQGNWMYPVIDLTSEDYDLFEVSAPKPKSLPFYFLDKEEKEELILEWQNSF